MALKLVIIGGGRMGSALMRGLTSSGWASPTELMIVEANEAQRQRLESGHHGLAAVSEMPNDSCPDAVLAVKPQDAEQACIQAASKGVRRLLSVAAGVTTQSLEQWMGPEAVVVRSMPNIPALVGHCAAGMAAGSRARQADLQWASDVLGSVGKAVSVPENMMDAVTGLSGSGPAYFFLVVEALTEAGVRVGLDREIASSLARQTFIGAARLMEDTGESAEDLRIAVTSPAGTTAAGIASLEESKARQAFIMAVAAATSRSAELGRANEESPHLPR
ncbi:MAG TPA: pyrroline-5-carboxylate reductase [Acidimicrobiales bacterium]|nr:pyrroline-5-carboxylate reductase [Acidimicrobiales bacterium]